MYILYILSIQKAFKRILREEILHRMGCHKESEMFFFSVYSHINTDYKITVPQKRKSTQSTSTVMNKFFLCTTETADPVQWVEQLYNEDVS